MCDSAARCRHSALQPTLCVPATSPAANPLVNESPSQGVVVVYTEELCTESLSLHSQEKEEAPARIEEATAFDESLLSACAEEPPPREGDQEEEEEPAGQDDLREEASLELPAGSRRMEVVLGMRPPPDQGDYLDLI